MNALFKNVKIIICGVCGTHVLFNVGSNPSAWIKYNKNLYILWKFALNVKFGLYTILYHQTYIINLFKKSSLVFHIMGKITCSEFNTEHVNVAGCPVWTFCCGGLTWTLGDSEKRPPEAVVVAVTFAIICIWIG